MSDDTSDQEKTESPSSKRLEDARKKGQVPRSKEFATFVVLALCFGTIAALAPWMLHQLKELIDLSMRIPHAAAHDTTAMFDFFRTVLTSSALIVAPVLCAAFIAAALAPIATNGYVFLPEKVSPDFTKLNPMNWFGRVFSKDGAIEVGKGILKSLLIGIVAYAAFRTSEDRMLLAAGAGLEGGIAEVCAVMFKVIGFVVLALATLAGADVPLELYMHHSKLKMTLQELKDESKETDGNPEIKGRIKRMQREMARRRMIDDVKKADVVITNPTHYAVALSYKDGKMGAPLMLAKGVDEVALRIREAAKEANVPIVESPKLARAIYATTEIEHEVPDTLYMAVAQVLSYAFAIKKLEVHGGAIPQLADVTVPDHLDPESKK
jgi:flagellar biosynthetic protein FlhB